MSSTPSLSRRALIAASLAALPLPALAASGQVVTILGDSITAGLGLPAQYSLPIQLHEALVKLGAWRIQNDYAQTAGTLMRFWPPALLLRHRLAGLQSHFDRTLHTGPIARIELRRTLWIQALQQAMKVFDAATFPQFV